MNSQAIQKLVRKIYSDDQARAQFISDPESMLSQIKLTGSEKQAVLQTHYKLGLVNANSAQLEETIDPTSLWASPVP